MKTLLKKFLPKSLINLYHFLKAHFAAFYFNYPSFKLKVVGITGTKGKSTTVYMLGKILNRAQVKTGWSCSISFSDGKKEIPNPFHMTMPDPFIIQKVLRQMVNNEVKFAILEVTSEGIKQYRHLGIKFDAAILTNLQPEHIEAHGGFENYKKAKLKLFEAVAFKKRLILSKGQTLLNQGLIIVNGDDLNAKDFLNFNNVEKWIFKSLNAKDLKDDNVVFYKIISSNNLGTKFIIYYKNELKEINLKLVGQFNALNAACAATCALAFGVKLDTIKEALEEIATLPGRMEFVNQGQNFYVIVDLAHTPDSFKAVFKAVESLKKPGVSKVITVFGAAGGGRDKWKRPVMGEIAAQNSDYIILTNEDPYDDNPQQIINDIRKGIDNQIKKSKFKTQELKVLEIFDRKEAIKKAIFMAQKDDIVLLLGKGTESSMVFENGRSISWNEKEIASKYLRLKMKSK